jgi:hypothetical protein
VAVGGHGCDHEFGSVLIRLFRPPNLGRNSNGTIAKLAAQVGYYAFLFCFALHFYPFLRSRPFMTLPDRHFMMPLHRYRALCLL